MNESRALVFGARGAIGSACAAQLEQSGVEVIRASRSATPDGQVLEISGDWIATLPRHSISSVVWAQGANSSGSILDAAEDDLTDLFEANVAFIARTARQLITASRLTTPCRFVIVSSVWQEFARADKFAYTVSKAALAGLVRSMTVDLAAQGISVNAVLPGVLDTPMARANLTSEQIRRVTADTPAGRLTTVNDVALTVSWLASQEASGITGQFICVDGGWGVARSV